MFAPKMFGRSLVFSVLIVLVTMLAPAAQAGNEDGYHFQLSESALDECGDLTPEVEDFDRTSDRDEVEIELTLEITSEQHETQECGGSHFNLRVELEGYDGDGDCHLDTTLVHVFGEKIFTEDDGTVVALIEGAKITDGTPEGNRLPAGTEVSIEITCDDMWPDDHGDPLVTAVYTGTWWSTEVGAAGCEETDYVTAGTQGPAGLPVCVYTGSSASLVNEDGDTEFPLTFTVNE